MMHTDVDLQHDEDAQFDLYNLKTEPCEGSFVELTNRSLVIHEDAVSQVGGPAFSIKGLDELDIPEEKLEIIKNTNYFKNLSLSFYPKEKLRTEKSEGIQVAKAKEKDIEFDNKFEAFRKNLQKKVRSENQHSNDFADFVKNPKMGNQFIKSSNKNSKLSLKFLDTQAISEPVNMPSSPKNFQIRKTFVANPREKKPIEFIAKQIYAPKGIMSPKNHQAEPRMVQSHLPTVPSEPGFSKSIEHNYSDINQKGNEKNQIAILLSKKTQNPQMVSVSDLKKLDQVKDTSKTTRKISFTRLDLKLKDLPPRISISKIEDNTIANTPRSHLNVCLPEFSFTSKREKIQTGQPTVDFLISPRKMKDQVLLIQRKKD